MCREGGAEETEGLHQIILRASSIHTVERELAGRVGSAAVWRRDAEVLRIQDGGSSVWVAEWPPPLTNGPSNATLGEAIWLLFLERLER